MNSISRIFVSGLTAGAAAGALTLAATAQPPWRAGDHAADPGSTAADARVAGARTSTFTGTIMKTDDTHVLRASSGSVYRLDDSTRQASSKVRR